MSIQPAEPAGLRLSFLGLIDRYGRVEIPLMQRDYAQGRKSAAVVRERFLAHLLQAGRAPESRLRLWRGRRTSRLPTY